MKGWMGTKPSRPFLAPPLFPFPSSHPFSLPLPLPPPPLLPSLPPTTHRRTQITKSPIQKKKKRNKETKKQLPIPEPPLLFYPSLSPKSKFQIPNSKSKFQNPNPIQNSKCKSKSKSNTNPKTRFQTQGSKANVSDPTIPILRIQPRF